MKKYTNRILLGLYGFGAVIILVTLFILRFRLDRVIELTV
jgi:hypothetical protein